MSTPSSHSGAIFTATAAAFVATVPPDVLNFAEKMGSALLLAIVAEAGRRLVSWAVERLRRK
jgi:hypothetical protein